jgi:mttA/Hcf106 family
MQKFCSRMQRWRSARGSAFTGTRRAAPSRELGALHAVPPVISMSKRRYHFSTALPPHFHAPVVAHTPKLFLYEFFGSFSPFGVYQPAKSSVMNMFGIGPMELLPIIVLALIVLGPAKLPEVMAQVGKGINEFR